MVRLYVKNGKKNTKYSYIITNDMKVDQFNLFEIYQKRWRIEEFHKNIKQNFKIEKSPTKVIVTQINHILFTFLSFLKMEQIILKSKTNIFYLKQNIFMEALRNSYQTLQNMKVSLC